MSTFKVKGCYYCPAHYEQRNSFCCNLNSGLDWEGGEYLTDEVWIHPKCPLKNEPVTLELDKVYE